MADLSHAASKARAIRVFQTGSSILAQQLIRLSAVAAQRALDPPRPDTLAAHTVVRRGGVGAWDRGSGYRDVAPWIYLFLLLAAEVTAVVVDARPGMILDAASLLALIHHGSRTRDEDSRALFWALALVPVSRILSLSLPLARLPVLDSYLVTGVPILGATAIASRAIGYTWGDLGLSPRFRDLPLALALVPVGLTLGLIDYLILHPEPWSSALTLQAAWHPALVLIAMAGFGEEVVYRGLLQTSATQALGRRGMIFVAILYAFMNVGYRSLLHLAFAFVVALAFAAIAWKARSILAVIAGHASLAVSLLLIAPFLPAPQSYALVMIFALLTATVFCMVVAAVILTLAPLGRTPAVLLRGRLAIPNASRQVGSTGIKIEGAATRQPLSRGIPLAAPAFAARILLAREVSYQGLFRSVVRAARHLLQLLALAVEHGARGSRRLLALTRDPDAMARVAARLRAPRWRSDLLEVIRTPDLWLAVALVLGRDVQEWVRRTMAARPWQPAVELVRAICRLAVSSVDRALQETRRGGAETAAAQGQNLVTLASPAIRLMGLTASELIEHGIDCIDAGRADEAYVYFSKAVEVDPENVRAWFWKAKTGRTLDEIIYCLERALTLDPGNRMVAANLALFQRRRRKWQEFSEI